MSQTSETGVGPGTPVGVAGRAAGIAVTVPMKIAEWFLRLSIAVGFLSAVADRFGAWGAAGEPGVAWGNWETFIGYVATLNWFVPAGLHGALGWIATIAEVVIAIGLLIGWKLRWFAFAAGLLTLIFGVTMTVALGPKAPLDYSVFAISAGAFYLAAVAEARRVAVLPVAARI